MSAEEESKALMHRFTNEFYNPGKLEVADEIIAPECPLYFASTLMGRGPKAFKQARTIMYSAFPDLHLTIEEMIAEGDALAQRYTGRGTHGWDGSIPECRTESRTQPTRATRSGLTRFSPGKDPQFEDAQDPLRVYDASVRQRVRDLPPRPAKRW